MTFGIEWLNDYGFGSEPDKIENPPSIEEVKKRLDEFIQELWRY